MKRTLAFDARDGTLLEDVELPSEDERTGPLATLPRSLTAADGTVFVFDAGNTRHLEAEVGTTTRIVRELEDFPYDLNVVGDLAIFSLAGNNSRRRAGEVVAYDLSSGALAWQFESWRHGPAPAYALTDVAVDEDRVLVAVDQVIYSLVLATGELLWRTELPRQGLRPWGNPWTRFGRLGDRLVIACYEDLFLLDRDGGGLLWSYDLGPFGKAWPTVAGGRLYVAVLEGRASMMSMSAGEVGRGKMPASLLWVRRTPAGDVTLERVTSDDVPAGVPAYSSLSATPKAGAAADEIVVKIVYGFPESGSFEIDLSGVLEGSEEAYVKFSGWISRIVASRNGRQVAELQVSD